MSRPPVLLTQSEVETSLRNLNIGFTSEGKVWGKLRYASLRAPCESGIYFLENNLHLTDAIGNSLILVGNQEPFQKDSNAYLRVDKPQQTFYRLMRLSYPVSANREVHPTALVASDCTVPDDCMIGPYCIIEAGVEIGNCCRLESHVVLKSGSRLGDRVHIEPHSTIGATGVAWTWNDEGDERLIQPQIGGVRIGNDVFLGSDVSIVRGSVNEDTEIGEGTVIAHGSKIGHGCRLGNQTHLANNVSLAGNVDAGDRAFFGSGAVVRPGVVIASDVVIGAGSVVVYDIKDAGTIVCGVPARPMKSSKDRYTGVPRSAGRSKNVS